MKFGISVFFISCCFYGKSKGLIEIVVSFLCLFLIDDVDKNEEVLRQFDLNMAYGPCIGMTRLDRWERAQRLGMNPPKEIEALLNVGKVRLDCLWDGRV